MKNLGLLPVYDTELRLTDQDGQGGYIDPVYTQVDPLETSPIIYPDVIEKLSTPEPVIEDYLPEQCIDCPIEPTIDTTTTDTTTPDTTTTDTTTTNKISDWIKANKTLALAAGAGVVLLLADKKKKKVSAKPRNNKRLLIAGAAAVGLYFLLKKKQDVAPPPENVDITTSEMPVLDAPELPVTTPTDPYAYSELDRSYYEQMWRLLSNNYLYQEHPYDYPFAGEVLKEYKFIVDGHPTSSLWNIGVPGAFMVMLDRWYRYYLTDTKKKLFQPTLYQIGDLYKAYVNQVSTL